VHERLVYVGNVPISVLDSLIQGRKVRRFDTVLYLVHYVT
jgi:hypothetical protein